MKRILHTFLFSLLTVCSYAQCAMCKATAESNLNDGGSMATGLNAGILYLMFIPYLLLGTLAYFIYKHNKKKKSQNRA